MIIDIAHLTYTYPGATTPALRDLSLQVEDGEFVLLAGESGAGKSTLLRALNGLVPHFYGGAIGGQVRVAGHDPIAEGPAAMSAVVGLVFQDPEGQMVADTVEDELAFGMENAGLPPALMRKRVEEVLDQLSIAHLRGRRLSTLSGGERQRVAIGAVLTLQPRVLVLDEPTSQLDPQAAEEVLDTLVKLNKDLGLTVVLSEHRLERVVQHVDRIVYLPPSGAAGQALLAGSPDAVLTEMPLAPPLAEVARTLGWRPVPLSIRDARRRLATDPRFAGLVSNGNSTTGELDAPSPVGTGNGVALQVERVWFSYGAWEALRGISLAARPGEVLALMGRNGAGKTTLLKLLVGLLKPGQGCVLVDGADTRRLLLQEIVRRVGYVPQRPDVLLFADSVGEELAFTRQNHGLPATGPALDDLLTRLDLRRYVNSDPKALSVGERQRVALAAILAAEPGALLLDEPTRGMDYRQKAALGRILRDLAASGHAIVLATHDVELAAQIADRVVLLGDGQVIVEGPAREVMSGSLVFASQVSKLFRDPRLVTPADVRAYLAQIPA